MMAINDRNQIGTASYSYYTLDLADYGQEFDSKLPSRPSDILNYAYEHKYRKIEGNIKDSKNGGYCASGVIVHLQESKGFRMYHYLKQKYQKSMHDIGIEHGEEIANTFLDLMKYNDSGPHITFKDCANFMREKGL